MLRGSPLEVGQISDELALPRSETVLVLCNWARVLRHVPISGSRCGGGAVARILSKDRPDLGSIRCAANAAASPSEPRSGNIFTNLARQAAARVLMSSSLPASSLRVPRAVRRRYVGPGLPRCRRDARADCPGAVRPNKRVCHSLSGGCTRLLLLLSDMVASARGCRPGRFRVLGGSDHRAANHGLSSGQLCAAARAGSN